VILLAAGCAGLRRDDTPAPRNIIIFIADGVAGAQIELARQASVRLRQRGLALTDVVFRRGALGLLSTETSGTLTTDSAAAATAMSTGVKTRNGMIAMMPGGERLATVLETAQMRGKRIGLVTTTAVSDATPAAFSVHAASRHDHDAIVDGYLRLEPEVLLGGGADRFVPASAGGRRRDGTDVSAAFAAKGYRVVRTAADLRAAGPDHRLLGLFAADDMAHAIDRAATSEPSLAEMTDTAFRVLDRDDGRGFVLLVESEGTDIAGHANDVAALVRDVWEFDRAVAVGLAFQARAPADTLIVVAGDHETGGLTPTLARRAGASGILISSGEHLDMIGRITMSISRAAALLGRAPAPDVLDALVARHFPGFTLDPDLRDAILQRRAPDLNFLAPTEAALSRMVARRTGFYWASSAHSGDPVVVGALGPGAELFRGWSDNTEFGRALHRLLAPR
jgi:alkaline phosphatase